MLKALRIAYRGNINIRPAITMTALQGAASTLRYVDIYGVSARSLYLGFSHRLEELHLSQQAGTTGELELAELQEILERCPNLRELGLAESLSIKSVGHANKPLALTVPSLKKLSFTLRGEEPEVVADIFSRVAIASIPAIVLDSDDPDSTCVAPMFNDFGAVESIVILGEDKMIIQNNRGYVRTIIAEDSDWNCISILDCLVQRQSDLCITLKHLTLPLGYLNDVQFTLIPDRASALLGLETLVFHVTGRFPPATKLMVPLNLPRLKTLTFKHKTEQLSILIADSNKVAKFLSRSFRIGPTFTKLALVGIRFFTTQDWRKRTASELHHNHHMGFPKLDVEFSLRDDDDDDNDVDDDDEE